MSESLFIGGLANLSACAWELSCRKAQTILVPDSSWALNLRDEFRVFDSQTVYQLLLPLESDLLRNRGPSLSRRSERIRFFCALSGLTQAPATKFIVSAEALAQHCPSKEFWIHNSFSVQVGAQLSRADFAARLAKLGYLPAELVEAECEYAVRGSIVDVFCPLYPNPLRFELLGDEIQSIRSFHPDSQRRIDELSSATLVPAREFLFAENPTHIDEERRRLRKHIEEIDWDSRQREAFVSRIQQQSFFPTIDYWASLISPEFFSQDLASSLHFDAIVEAAAVESAGLLAVKEIERNFRAASQDGEWVPAAPVFSKSDVSVRDLLKEKIMRAPLWLSTKAQAVLPLEARATAANSTQSLDALVARLSASRALQREEPLEELASTFKDWLRSNKKIIVASSSLTQIERLGFLLSYYSLQLPVAANFEEALKSKWSLLGVVGQLSDGFLDDARSIAIILDEQIFGTRRKKSSLSKKSSVAKASGVFGDDLSMLDLKINDLVVHRDHGIGRYLGLKSIGLGGVNAELVELEYREGSKLLIPVTRLNVLQKHSGDSSAITLDRMGGQSWAAKKSAVKKDLISIAGELLNLYTLREMSQGPAINPPEKAIDEFASTFPFVETPDQESAIRAVLADLRGPKPMDRLLCGDVGYGKTEVAIRAAFSTVRDGYQAAVLVPTTLLAVQHEQSFKKRLAPFGFKVEGVSRLRSAKEVKEILGRVKSGETHVVIGTHRLLGQDVNFQKLGLLVVDEEQKFGVVHKEKIKKMRVGVHVLAMTATPIPRTLNMALSGLKELSIITTAPADRLSVRTHVAKKKDALLKEAVMQELHRGGQVFYVHNRVQTMPKAFDELKRLLPEVSIEWVHGQMDEHQLEERMLNFYKGQTQLLLTTTIIESGLDVPNANTLIVERADTFGLSQLYQMRGRVGRSNQRAYAYFLLPEAGNITTDAEERLAVLESYQDLGSGFHIASHDLEIRGSGDLLGRSQSGHIIAIGFDAYVEMLQESVAELKGERLEQRVDPEINLGLDTTIPDSYVFEPNLRLLFYRQLASATEENEVDAIEGEISDRFGPPPPSVKNLVAVMRVKCQLRRLGVKSMTAGKLGFSISFDPSTPIDAAKLVESIKRYPAQFQLHPDGRLLLKRQTGVGDPEKIMRSIEAALSQLETWVA